MTGNGSCTVTNKTKGTQALARVPFVAIKNKILGEKYELSITFLTASMQRKINKKYRNKDETTNILSFPLSKTSGEITLDPLKIKSESPLFEMSYSQFLKYLVIHGTLHLKGFEHSSTMEKEEEKYLNMFS